MKLRQLVQRFFGIAELSSPQLENPHVIQGHFAQLLVFDDAQLFCFQQVVQCQFVLAQFKLAQTEHGVSRAVCGIQGDEFFEIQRGLCVIIKVIFNGAQRPPAFLPTWP